MIRVGIAGFGFMGSQHLNCFDALRGVRVVSICDSDKTRLKGNIKIRGNIAGSGKDSGLSGAALYTNFEKMLAEQRLDAVSITLPTYLHRDFTIKALEAGVHVFCEKPMAMNVGDCEKMIAAAKANRKVLQIGHCIRFWPEYAAARKIIKSGRYGKVRTASLRRVGPVPGWSWKNWLVNARKSGGAIMDLHIHDTDFVLHLFGLPAAVRSQAVVGPSGGFDYVTTQYVYKDRKVVTAEGGFVASLGLPFEMSFIISLEKATLVYDCRCKPTLLLYPAKGKSIAPKVESGNGWSREIEHFIKKITGRKVPRIISPLDSLNAVKIVLAESQSARTKKEVKIR